HQGGGRATSWCNEMWSGLPEQKTWNQVPSSANSTPIAAPQAGQAVPRIAASGAWRRTRSLMWSASWSKRPYAYFIFTAAPPPTPELYSLPARCGEETLPQRLELGPQQRVPPFEPRQLRLGPRARRHELRRPRCDQRRQLLHVARLHQAEAEH